MVTTTLKIKANPKQIWQALTKKDHQKVWYFDIPDFGTEPGTVFEFYESEAKQYLHRCEVLDSVENKLLIHTWTHPNESKGSSVVTWKIEENGENAEVTLTHEGLESFSDGGDALKPENYQMGWDAIVKTNLRNFLVGIKRLEYEIEIDASPEKIWNVLWDKELYKKWTECFYPGSHYTGKIENGGRIHFLSPSGNGMYSNIVYLMENTHIVFQHIGDVKDNKEMPLDESTMLWTGCFEMYKLTELEKGKTTLLAEVDCMAEHLEFMKEKFPLGLEKIKELSEQ